MPIRYILVFSEISIGTGQKPYRSRMEEEEEEGEEEEKEEEEED
jgi:hypothetical protein